MCFITLVINFVSTDGHTVYIVLSTFLFDMTAQKHSSWQHTSTKRGAGRILIVHESIHRVCMSAQDRMLQIIRGKCHRMLRKKKKSKTKWPFLGPKAWWPPPA